MQLLGLYMAYLYGTLYRRSFIFMRAQSHIIVYYLSPFNDNPINLPGFIPAACGNRRPPLHRPWHWNDGGIPIERENNGQGLCPFDEQEWWSWEARV